MGSHHPIRKAVAPEAPQIPDKLYFRIGDVARLCEVPAYVLRFWETEFAQLKPNKGGTGQRLYRRKDVEMALRIKSLLYDQGYTISGARQVFKTETSDGGGREPAVAVLAAPLSVPAPVVAAEAEVVDVGATIRQRAQQQARLQELRAEMVALLDLLGGTALQTPQAATETKLKPMRPRLVLEPRPQPKAEPRAEPKLRLEQRDLFSFEPLDAADTAQAFELAE